MAEDVVCTEMRDLLKMVLKTDNDWENTRLVFITGRPSRTAALTHLWLQKWVTPWVLSDDTDYLYFNRIDGDHRPSADVKAELLQTFLDDYDEGWDNDTEFSVFDDDPQNLVAMKDVLLDAGMHKFETFCVGTGRF